MRIKKKTTLIDAGKSHFANVTVSQQTQHSRTPDPGPRAAGNLCQLNSLSWAAPRQAEVQMLVNRCCAKHSTKLTPMEKCVVRQ